MDVIPIQKGLDIYLNIFILNGEGINGISSFNTKLGWFFGGRFSSTNIGLFFLTWYVIVKSLIKKMQ